MTSSTEGSPKAPQPGHLVLFSGRSLPRPAADHAPALALHTGLAQARPRTGHIWERTVKDQRGQVLCGRKTEADPLNVGVATVNAHDNRNRSGTEPVSSDVKYEQAKDEWSRTISQDVYNLLGSTRVMESLSTALASDLFLLKSSNETDDSDQNEHWNNFLKQYKTIVESIPKHPNQSHIVSAGQDLIELLCHYEHGRELLRHLGTYLHGLYIDRLASKGRTSSPIGTGGVSGGGRWQEWQEKEEIRLMQIRTNLLFMLELGQDRSARKADLAANRFIDSFIIRFIENLIITFIVTIIILSTLFVMISVLVDQSQNDTLQIISGAILLQIPFYLAYHASQRTRIFFGLFGIVFATVFWAPLFLAADATVEKSKEFWMLWLAVGGVFCLLVGVLSLVAACAKAYKDRNIKAR